MEIVGTTGETINLVGAGAGALVIYGLVGQAVRVLPEKIRPFAFFLNLILGIIFGFFGLFGLTGLESGILASLASTGANAFIKRAKE